MVVHEGFVLKNGIIHRSHEPEACPFVPLKGRLLMQTRGIPMCVCVHVSIYHILLYIIVIYSHNLLYYVVLI